MKERKLRKNKINRIGVNMKSKNDPYGSYTGNPIKNNDKPEQDADDL